MNDSQLTRMLQLAGEACDKATRTTGIDLCWRITSRGLSVEARSPCGTVLSRRDIIWGMIPRLSEHSLRSEVNIVASDARRELGVGRAA